MRQPCSSCPPPRRGEEETSAVTTLTSSLFASSVSAQDVFHSRRHSLEDSHHEYPAEIKQPCSSCPPPRRKEEETMVFGTLASAAASFASSVSAQGVSHSRRHLLEDLHHEYPAEMRQPCSSCP